MSRNTNHIDRHRYDRWTAAALLFAVALSAGAYLSILRAYFHADDFLHLYQMRNFDPLSVLVSSHAGHAYVVRNAVFLLCWRAFGMQPLGYHAVALVLHLVNVALLFVAVRRLTASDRLACFAAAMWGVCPEHRDVLVWAAVFGHALAGTALLVILVQLAGVAASGRTPTRRMLIGWYVLAIAGATCFGVGIGVALVLPWVIALLAPGRYPWWRPPLWSLVVVVPLVYVASMQAYRLRWGAPVDVIGTTQLVIGASGWRLPIAAWQLMTYGLAQLMIGLWLSPGLGAAAVLGTVGLIALAAVAVSTRGRAARQLAACGLLAVAAYGIIAVGRGFLFLSAPQLLTIASRYHYVGLMAFAIAIAIALGRLAEAPWPSLQTAARLAFVAWLFAAAGAIKLVRHPINLGIQDTVQVQHLRDEVAAAIAPAAPGQPAYLRNRFFQALVLPPTTFPKSAAVFTLVFPDGALDGHRVYFVESDDATRAAAAPGEPIGDVLVAPADVPPDTVVH